MSNSEIANKLYELLTPFITKQVNRIDEETEDITDEDGSALDFTNNFITEADMYTENFVDEDKEKAMAILAGKEKTLLEELKEELEAMADIVIEEAWDEYNEMNEDE